MSRAERAHHAEAGESQLADAGLRPACDHHVGCASADDLGGVAYGLGRGGACGNDGAAGAARGEVAAHVGRGHVRQDHREEEGRQAHPAAFEEDAHALVDGGESAVAVAEIDADALNVHVRGGEPRAAHCLACGDDGQLREPRQPPSLALLDIALGVEIGDFS